MKLRASFSCTAGGQRCRQKIYNSKDPVTTVGTKTYIYLRLECHLCPYRHDARRARSTDTDLAQQSGEGKLHQQESRVNWGQHAELKRQAISFIHINLAKVAKRAKLIRLIDFPPLSDSLSVFGAHLAAVLTYCG